MSTSADLALLRRFEPIIRYTRGEEFLPVDVAQYVEACDLWMQRPGSAKPARLVPKSELTLDMLAEPTLDEFGTVFFLKFADPLTATELATYKLQQSLGRSKFRGMREASRQMTDTFSTLSKSDAENMAISKLKSIALAEIDPENVFHAGGGRLARVGYASRFVHALYLLSLLGRGRVPGDAAAAAAITYKSLIADTETYRYCGRVVRQNGWTILQYWFLYAFNNWRSGFYGFNDHEADWEMICIYLSEAPDGNLAPEWVAYASHDFAGDDLRRRWDDPELEKEGEHPVIYAGAGSHASYYTAGEYLVELEIPFLTPLSRVTNYVRTFWRERLRQFYDEEDMQPEAKEEEKGVNIFHLPFVDYARGDGFAVGPGQQKSWDAPYIISEPPLWLSQYRGLWGIYVQDPLAGENAPAGPMYNRDGTVRRAWYDPLGWAGLDKIPTAYEALERMRQQHDTLATRQTELTQIIEKKSHTLTGLGIEASAMQNHPHLKKIYEAHQETIQTLAAEIDQLRAEFAQNKSVLEAFNLHAQLLWRGERGPARAHIRRAATPIPETELQIGRLMETWAAISIGLILISLVAVLFFAPQNWFMSIITIVALVIIIEATFRRRLTQLITHVTIGLAMFAALVLALDFLPHIMIILALVAGGYMVWQNLRELWS